MCTWWQIWLKTNAARDNKSAIESNLGVTGIPPLQLDVGKDIRGLPPRPIRTFYSAFAEKTILCCIADPKPLHTLLRL